MTLKNTILVSAAIYFVINFILWAAGWMIWPIVWLIIGHIGIKVDEKYSGYVSWLGVSVILGPIVFIVSVAENWELITKDFNLPKFRNPLVWPEKSE